MGFEIKNTPSASAPNVDDGLVPAIFNHMAMVEHPDWATPTGKFGPDDGRRLHWNFTLTDAAFEALYDEGDPITVEAVNSSNLNTKSDKSKNAIWLKAISPAAFAAVDAGQGFDANKLEGSRCMLLLEIKDNGWPKIVNVLPAPKTSSRRAAASNDEE